MDARGRLAILAQQCPKECEVTDLHCFKSYDHRGRVWGELNEGVAARVGHAFAQARGARRVVLGRDCRASSEGLAAAVAAGLRMAGAEGLDLGLCGTEEMDFR